MVSSRSVMASFSSDCKEMNSLRRPASYSFSPLNLRCLSSAKAIFSLQSTIVFSNTKILSYALSNRSINWIIASSFFWISSSRSACSSLNAENCFSSGAESATFYSISVSSSSIFRSSSSSISLTACSILSSRFSGSCAPHSWIIFSRTVIYAFLSPISLSALSRSNFNSGTENSRLTLGWFLIWRAWVPKRRVLMVSARL